MCDSFCTRLTLKGQLLRTGNPLGRERFFALMPFHIVFGPVPNGYAPKEQKTENRLRP